MKNNDILLDVIIAALKGYVLFEEGKESSSTKWRDEDKINFSYLLGQSIRQWQIPKGNWHMSNAAQKVWKKITCQEIMPHLQNRDLFVSKSTEIIPSFEGSTRNFCEVIPFKVEPGVPYAFNAIFTAEHTIPVSEIREVLVYYYKEEYISKGESIETLRSKVAEILNMMHITQMLKIEDRRIKICSSRIERLIKGKENEAYKYLKCRKDKVYDDLRDFCYGTEKNQLPAKSEKEIKKINELGKYNKVQDEIKQKYSEIPDWAGALILNEGYKIEIIPNNPDQQYYENR